MNLCIDLGEKDYLQYVLNVFEQVHNIFNWLEVEAVPCRCSPKKELFETLYFLQESTLLVPCRLELFFCEFQKLFKNTVFHRTSVDNCFCLNSTSSEITEVNFDLFCDSKHFFWFGILFIWFVRSIKLFTLFLFHCIFW